MDAPELGKMLIKAGILTQAQLGKALDFQKEVGGRLPVVLVKLGLVDEKRLVQHCSKDQNLPIVDLDELILPVNLIRRIPKDIMERHQILPVSWNAENETLTVVTFDPYDLEALEELQIAVDCKVVINLATRSQIVRTINEFFYREERQDALGGADGAQAAKGKGGRRDGGVPDAWKEALVPLLLEKRLISEKELDAKAKDLGLIKS
jgi:type IV pilus assembly protein PilB